MNLEKYKDKDGWIDLNELMEKNHTTSKSESEEDSDDSDKKEEE